MNFPVNSVRRYPTPSRLAGRAVKKGYRYGVAFHIGSQCLDGEGFEQGLQLADEVIRGVGAEPVCVDVGGGFPGEYLNSMGQQMGSYFSSIKKGLSGLSLPDDCRVLCEPGRALCVDGESLITQVHLRKDEALYLNDGMYGSFIEEKYNLHLPMRPVATRSLPPGVRTTPCMDRPVTRWIFFRAPSVFRLTLRRVTGLSSTESAPMAQRAAPTLTASSPTPLSR